LAVVGLCNVHATYAQQNLTARLLFMAHPQDTVNKQRNSSSDRAVAAVPLHLLGCSGRGTVTGAGRVPPGKWGKAGHCFPSHTTMQWSPAWYLHLLPEKHEHWCCTCMQIHALIYHAGRGISAVTALSINGCKRALHFAACWVHRS